MNATLTVSQRAAITMKDPRWAAVVARDPAADGTFYYSVATTGVYCRPSCAARLARPENVRFHATRADAEQAGFRPCKRCKPGSQSLAQEHAAIVAKACRIIAESEELPLLDDLAIQVGLSPYHFHRIFKQATGLTPRGYAAAQREQRVRDGLARGTSVTTAIFDAGYNASSRFYEKSGAVLGMTPKKYRSGADALTITYAVGDCSLGRILVAQTEKGLCAIFMGNAAGPLVQELQRRFSRATLEKGDRAFEKILAKVIAKVEHPERNLDLPLDIIGTAFQKRVWDALRTIPAGTTVTYSDIAKRINAPKAVRAVGTACGANQLAVVIPCHRVLGSNGALSGYRWGLKRKQALLDKEARKRG